MERSPLLSVNIRDRSDEQKHFSVCGLHIGKPVLLFIIGFGAMVGLAGQSVTLPLYESTFEHGSPYFILWLCSLSFTVIFGVWSLLLVETGNITREMVQLRWHPLMILVGVCDAFNGIFIVYSSILKRVSGPLQGILSLTMLPFTIVFSRLLLKTSNTWQQLAGGLLVLIGSVFCLIPTLHRVHIGELDISTSAWWWPLIFLLGQAPGAMMNVLQQKLQDKFRAKSYDKPLAHQREFSVVYFQAVESFYQLLAITFLFFFDILPNFGSSETLSDFVDNFRFGWYCLVNSSDEWVTDLSDRCNYNGGLAVLFITFYVMSYVFNTLATRHASANLLATISTVSPIAAMSFWLIFPDVNSWGGGDDFTAMDIGFNIGSLGFILPGIWMFYRFAARNNSSPPEFVGTKSNGPETLELCLPQGGCFGDSL